MTVSSSVSSERVLDGRSHAPNVWLKSLCLTQFRSYPTLELALDERPVILTGPNGAGKTNLLEAVSMLSPGRGLRGAELKALARTSGATDLIAVAPYLWTVLADLSVAGEIHRIGTGAELSTNGGCRRQLKIDGEACETISALGRFVRLVWLTPTHDRLFMDGKSERRRFLDRLVLSHDPDHASRVNAYERAQRERQKLLKDGQRDASWFEALEAAMAEHGIAIAAARVDLVDRLQQTIAARLPSPFPKAALSLEGSIEAGFCEGQSATDLEDAFVMELARGRPRDAEAGRALTGPHRTDLVARHIEKDMPAHLCSTGEQKALLIGVFLANAELMRQQEMSAAPLLLLDEVAAHLDDARRQALFDEICTLGCQTWMTGTDQSLFESLGARAQNFVVEDSRVRRI